MSNQQFRKDAGKLPVGEIYKQFPNAIEEVARVIAFGATKYESHSWIKIDDFENRAFNSLNRHLLAQHAHRVRFDPESGCMHLAHAAWNALAMLEYVLTAAGRSISKMSCEADQPSNDSFLGYKDLLSLLHRLDWSDPNQYYDGLDFNGFLNTLLARIGGSCAAEEPSNDSFLDALGVAAIERRLCWLWPEEDIVETSPYPERYGLYNLNHFTKDINLYLSKIGGRCE